MRKIAKFNLLIEFPSFISNDDPEPHMLRPKIIIKQQKKIKKYLEREVRYGSEGFKNSALLVLYPIFS